MASTYSNLFDLLGGDETDDNVSDLYERLKKKADEEVPSSPPKTRRQYIVFAENSENVDSKEEAHVNGIENGTKSDEEGWKVVSKRVYVKKFQEYGNENANGDGSEQIKENGDVNGNGNGRGGKKRGRGKRGKGNVRDGNGDNGEVKDSSNVGNGDGVESVVADNPTVNSEVDAGVTVEALNGEETKETEITEEVKADVPKPEETAEQRKERLRREQDEKEKAEKRRLRRLEAEEEAKKMTLDQYEKTLLEKKQALNVEKAKPTRVVSADEDFDNMKLVGKKLDNDEILIVEKEKPKGKAALVKSTSESKLEKSESFDKGTKSENSEEKSESFDKGTKSLAVDLAELFQPKPFRPPSFRGGRSWRERNHENQGGVVHRLPSQNGSTRNKLPRKNGPPDEKVLEEDQIQFPVLEDQIQFPVLGFVPPVLPPESSAPPANPTTPSEPNSSESAAPPANPSTLSEPNSSESSAPPADPSTSSEPNSTEPSAPPANPSTPSEPKSAEARRPYMNRGKRNKNNRSHAVNLSTTRGANTASATRSATATAAANSPVTAER